MIDFGAGNATRYYAIPAHAAIRLPNARWALGMCWRGDDNAGTDSQYLLSLNTGANNSADILWYDASHANAGKIEVRLQDRDGTVKTLLSSAAVPADGTLRWLIVQRTAAQFELWICAAGAAAALAATATLTDMHEVRPNSLSHRYVIGARSDLAGGTWFHEELAGLHLIQDGSMTQGQIEALAATAPHPRALGHLAMLPRLLTPGATLVDTQGRGHAIRNGSGWPTATADPTGYAAWFDGYDEAHPFQTPTAVINPGGSIQTIAPGYVVGPTSMKAGANTYISYAGKGGNGYWISEYPAGIYHRMRGPTTVGDNHMLSALLRKADGTITAYNSHAIYASGDGLREYNSTLPDTISGGFNTPVQFTGDESGSWYPHAYLLSDGTISLLYRDGNTLAPREWSVFRRSVGGVWTEHVIFAGTDSSNFAPYYIATKDPWSDDIFVVIFQAASGTGFGGRFERYFILRGTSCFDLAGTPIVTPTSDFTDFPEMLVDSPAPYGSSVMDVRIRAGGIIDVLANQYITTGEVSPAAHPVGRNRIIFYRWTGSTWSAPVKIVDFNDTIEDNTLALPDLYTGNIHGGRLHPTKANYGIVPFGDGYKSLCAAFRVLDDNSVRFWPLTLADGPDTTLPYWVQPYPMTEMADPLYAWTGNRGTYQGTGDLWTTQVAIYPEPADPFAPSETPTFAGGSFLGALTM